MVKGYEPPTSDVPITPKEHSPGFLKLKESCAKIEEFEKNVKSIGKVLGVIDWRYPITEDHPYNPSELTNSIINRKEYRIITDQKTQVIYFWNTKTGIYHKDGEVYLRFLIDNVLGLESKTHRINEVIELLKIRTYATIIPSQKIAVQNGLLDITTGTIEPFTPLEFVTNKLNAEYKEGIVSEPWLNFIDQICPDDKELLQEWSGYLLVKDYPFHSMMWLYGPKGRNGKGTWARTMQSILGEENYSNVSIDEFDGKHRFAVFDLNESLFNICSEPRTDKALTIEMLQMLTGQDTVDAERKGIQGRFKFSNRAKMTVMGNKFPNVIKPTPAFWERLKLIKFPNTFTGNNQVQNLEKTWLDDPDQRSAILNWMIEGARRLFTNGGLTTTKTQEETIIQFKRASDPNSAFISECLNFDGSTTPKIDTYNHYKTYCDAIGVQPDSNTKFNDRLRNEPKIRELSTRILKKKIKAWRGFSLKPIPEMEEIENEDIEDEEEQGTQSTLPESGTSGTESPTLIPAKNSENENKIGIAKKAVPAVPAVPLETPKPRFLYKQVPPAEKCDCAKAPVEYELESPQGDILRCCPKCFQVKREFFKNAEWIPKT